MHCPSRFVGRFGCTILAAALALPASGCSRSEPSAPAAAVPPTLTRVLPNVGLRGGTEPVTLTGSNFVVGTSRIVWSGDITVTDVTVVNSTTITANIAIAPLASLGPAYLYAATGTSVSSSVTFVVRPPAPTLTSVTPSVGAQGTTVPVMLVGTNFIIGATTVAVDGRGVTTRNVSVISGTSLTADLVIAADAAGTYAVTVTTASGASVSKPFAVQSAPLTSVTPKHL